MIRKKKITLIADSYAAFEANFANSIGIKNKIYFNSPGIELNNYIYQSVDKYMCEPPLVTETDSSYKQAWQTLSVRVNFS